MKATTIGLDLAKNVFQLHGEDEHGRVVVRKKLTRAKVEPRCSAWLTRIADLDAGVSFKGGISIQDESNAQQLAA